MGCLSERKETCWNYIQSFNTGETNTTLQRVSDLLLCQVENWLCSPTVYRTHLKGKESDIKTLFNNSIAHIDERRELNFNLFDGWLN